MSAAGSNIRALNATALRAVRFYFRYRFQTVMIVFNSLVWLPPFYFLGQAFAVDGRIPGLASYTGIHDYATFLVVGWIVAAHVYSAFWGIGFTLAWEMLGGTLEVNWLAPVPRWVLIIGNSIPDLIRTTISSAVLLIVAWFGLDIRFTPEAARAALLLAPALVGLYGIGFAVGALVLVVKDPSNIVDMVSYFTNVLAGDRLPPASFPVPLFVLSLAIPLTYAFDGMRHAVLGTTPLLPFALEAAILVAFAIGMTALGLWVLGAADRRSRRLGTLSHH